MASGKVGNEVERSRWWRALRVAGALLASTATVWPVAAAAVAYGRDAAPSMVGARARVVLSTDDMSRALASRPPVTFQSRAPAGAEVVHVNDRHTYQAFLGAGAAMTDTSAWLIHALPSAVRTRLLQSLFGARGLNLNFVRVPIGASDFTARGVPYTHDDAPVASRIQV
jgi:glucosylceramidase